MGRRYNKIDYHSYRGRGRRSANDVLKLVVAVLAALVLIAVAALVYAQRYIVYTEDGFYFNFPFRSEPAREEQESLPEIKTQIVVPEPEPEPVQALISLPLSAVSDGTAGTQAAQAGATGVILNMKDDAGQLYWYVEDSLAAGMGVNNQPQEMNTHLSALTQSELYTVARISCFKDHGLGASTSYAILTNSGYRWTDPEGVRWVSPASEAVQDYLLARMVELAQLGFDEILLDNCGYPIRGNLGYIRPGEAYDTQNLSVVISAFLERAAAALEPYGTILSVRCGEGVLQGEDETSGLTAEALELYAGRLWMEEDGERAALLARLEQGEISDGEKRLVTICPALQSQPEFTQAVLPLLSF